MEDTIYFKQNGSYKLSYRCMSYLSPFIVGTAIMLVILFAGLEIRSKFGSTIVKKLAPLSFSVYLIHTNLSIFDYVLKGKLAFMADYSTGYLLCAVLGAAAAIYLVCSLIDAVRSAIFKQIHISQLSKNIWEFVSVRVNVMAEIIANKI